MSGLVETLPKLSHTLASKYGPDSTFLAADHAMWRARVLPQRDLSLAVIILK